MKKDGKAEMLQLLCGLTPLPLAKPSSITADAGPSSWKPHECTFTQGISWWTCRQNEGGHPASHSDMQHLEGSAVTRCLAHVQEDIAASNYSTLLAELTTDF